MTLSASSSTQLAYWCQRVHRAKPPPRHSGAGFQIVIHLCLRNLLPWPFKLLPLDSDTERLDMRLPLASVGVWAAGLTAEVEALPAPPRQGLSHQHRHAHLRGIGVQVPKKNQWRPVASLGQVGGLRSICEELGPIFPDAFGGINHLKGVGFFHTGVSPGRFYSSRGAVGWIARMNTKKMNNVVLTVAEG